jgi:hypothetical protein
MTDLQDAICDRLVPARFGGWLGVPADPESIDELWPLGKGPGGRLVIIAPYRGYNGPPHLGLQEFDFFRGRYGLRKARPGAENGRQGTNPREGERAP